jgi:hypothetical protein
MKIKVGDLVGHTRDRGPSGPGLVIRTRVVNPSCANTVVYLVKFNSSPEAWWRSAGELAKIERR